MSRNIYHITHIDNLKSILEHGGLISNNKLIEEQINYLDIAHERIQGRRSKISIPCGNGGLLHDYIPFYFAPRSPMLYAIHKGKVKGYSDGQKSIIYLVVTIQAIQNSGLAFVFTDGHAIMINTEFFDNLNNLDDVIDWELMKSKYWHNNIDNPNRKWRRQAEFLIHEFCPWKLIRGIGVIDDIMKSQVEEILKTFNSQTPVKVKSEWYYRDD